MTENRGIERKTIIQVFPDWYVGNGIFSYLANNAVPWKAENFTAELDNLYIGRSGYKYISTLLEKILGDKEAFTEAQLQQIAANIYCKFNKSWNKLYNTLSLEYNPISNYDMTETSEDNGTGSKTIDRTGTLSRDGTRTAQGNTEQSTDTSQNNDIYGFNSNSPVGDTTGNGTTSANQNSSANETNTQTDTNTSKDTESATDTKTHTLTRSGNIGVTTSQQMIEAERNLWFWNFFDQVFKDIDSILTLKIY